MEETKKVSVKIQGRDYKVSCTEDEEYIQKIAYYVDKKIGQVMSSNPALDIQKATTLVSLNLADNLFKAVKSFQKICGKNGVKTDDEFFYEIEKLAKEGIPSTDVEKS